MTISERKAQLENYLGQTRVPQDFAEMWRARLKGCAHSQVTAQPVPFANAAAVYEQLTVTTQLGETISARYLRPAGEGPFPTVLMFHDLGRGVRGWHHMTRFIALGYAVAALENRVEGQHWPDRPERMKLERCYTDALALGQAVLERPDTDREHLVTWGEGFGAGLAIVAAALLPGDPRCAALNPMPADLSGKGLGMVDLVSFAPLLRGELLLGTGLMDQTAPPEGQYAIYNRAVCPKRHLVYPKYGHERINFFENEVLIFLHR
jgi:cephalosporin-C deacetylase-like acetyl esterase